MKATDLETLRSILADQRTHIAVGKITQLSLVEDRSCLKCLVLMLDSGESEREIVARMSWETVGPEAGVFQFPSVNDLVLVAFPDGQPDDAHIIRRLTSIEDKIPLNAVDGHLVMKALAGKKAWLTASRLNLSKADAEPTEPLVLGTQLQTLLMDIFEQIDELIVWMRDHTHTGNLGFPTAVPDQLATLVPIKEAFAELKASPIEDALILSDFAFTEKGVAE